MGKLYCAKEIAAMLGIHTRTLRRRVKQFRVPPTIPAHACNRWDGRAVKRLLNRIKKHHEKNRTSTSNRSRPGGKKHRLDDGD